MTLEGDVILANIRHILFNTYDELIDYCRFISPEELKISKLRDQNGIPTGYQLQFYGSEGMQ